MNQYYQKAHEDIEEIQNETEEIIKRLKDEYHVQIQGSKYLSMVGIIFIVSMVTLCVLSDLTRYLLTFKSNIIKRHNRISYTSHEEQRSFDENTFNQVRVYDRIIANKLNDFVKSTRLRVSNKLVQE